MVVGIHWHSLALTESGRVFGWGENYCGQLGVDVENSSEHFLLFSGLLQGISDCHQLCMEGVSLFLKCCLFCMFDRSNTGNILGLTA